MNCVLTHEKKMVRGKGTRPNQAAGKRDKSGHATLTRYIKGNTNAGG